MARVRHEADRPISDRVESAGLGWITSPANSDPAGEGRDRSILRRSTLEVVREPGFPGACRPPDSGRELLAERREAATFGGELDEFGESVEVDGLQLALQGLGCVSETSHEDVEDVILASFRSLLCM